MKLPLGKATCNLFNKFKQDLPPVCSLSGRLVTLGNVLTTEANILKQLNALNTNFTLGLFIHWNQVVKYIP